MCIQVCCVLCPFQVDGGYLQFRFNLGSGSATARQTTVQVNDDKSHTVTVERKERTVTLVIDGTYVARATSPAESNTLDIQSDRVYLGASIDGGGKAQCGFTGCITGAKLNHKDLPVSGSTKDYVANPSSGVGSGCVFEPSQGGAFPTVVTIAAGSVGFLLLVIVLPVGIMICLVGHYGYRRRKRRGGYNPRHRHTDSHRPSFNWHPVPQQTPPTGDSRHRLMLSQSSQVSASDSFALQEVSRHEGSLFVPSTPAVSEHAFRTPEQTPQQPTKNHSVDKSIEEQQQPSPQRNRHIRRLQYPEQHRQHSDKLSQPMQRSTESLEATEPPSVSKVLTQFSNDSTSGVPSRLHAPSLPVLQHTRSPSGHQSIMTTATEKSEAGSIFDDTEVGKYVLKRIEAANEELRTLQRDEMIPFKEEGEFEPLGSIGSLYDFVIEADENCGPSEHTVEKPAIKPPLKPKPQLSTRQPHPLQPPDSHVPSTKHTKLKPREEPKQPDHVHVILSEKEALHAKSNGVQLQPVDHVHKPRGKRREKRAVPALGAGESLMDKFQNMSTSPPKSKEWDDRKLV